ncbi:MAG: lytic transglycosylase domain-containing protein [Nitrospiria bacterium]
MGKGVDFQVMDQYKSTYQRAWLLTIPMALFFISPFFSELAVPGPIPISEEKLFETTTQLAPEKHIRTEREEKIFQILSKFYTGLKSAENEKLVSFISEESDRYGFDPELILALISTESSFYNWSVSGKGALGLMQIVPNTGKQLAKMNKISWPEQEDHLFDPIINVKLGIHYLHMLTKKFGNVNTALTAYNFGPTRVRRWIKGGKSIPTGYANKVLRIYKNYKDLVTVVEELGENADSHAKTAGTSPARRDISKVSIRS